MRTKLQLLAVAVVTAGVLLAAFAGGESAAQQQEMGDIVVHKMTYPSGTGTSFPFELRDQTGTLIASFSLMDMQAPWNSPPLAPGINYELKELVPAGWELEFIDCVIVPTNSAADDVSVRQVENPVTISIGEGDHIRCRFFNDQLPAEEFVPEPASMLLLGSGLAGLAGYAALRLRSR